MCIPFYRLNSASLESMCFPSYRLNYLLVLPVEEIASLKVVTGRKSILKQPFFFEMSNFFAATCSPFRFTL